MKKNQNILEKLKLREYRAGIDRITVESQTFKTVRVLFFITLSVNLLMNAIYCLSLSYTTNELVAQAGGWSKLTVAGQDGVMSNRTSIWFVAALSALLVAGLVFLIKKIHIAALALTAAPLISLMIHLGLRAGENGLYVSLWKSPYLYEFLIPMLLTLGFSAWYTIVGIIHDCGENKAYNEFVSRLYSQYADKFDKLTDEEWENFLSEYKYERPQDKKEKRKKETV